MNTSGELYLVLGALIATVGLVATAATGDHVRRVVAVNVMGTGIFVLFAATAWRSDPADPDPVPHALVLTGIVVAVSVTAVALALARRVEEAEWTGPDEHGTSPAPSPDLQLRTTRRDGAARER